MSRIGRKPIVIPAGVTVTVDEAAHTVAVKGPKGSLNSNYHPLMTVKVEGNEVLVTRPNDEPKARSREMNAIAEDIRREVLAGFDSYSRRTPRVHAHERAGKP